MELKYDLMTLRPEKIAAKKEIAANHNGHLEIYFTLDFRSGQFDEGNVLKSTGSYPENALLRQLRLTLLDKEPNRKINKESLQYQLFFLDFKSLFQGKDELKEPFDMEEFESRVEGGGVSPKELDLADWNVLLFFMFRNGFKIQFNDGVRNYIPFEGSGSMSRQCRISFLNEALKPAMDERILLGMDLVSGKINVKQNKYFAYRALYMTNGFRIQTKEEKIENPEKGFKNNLELNEQTVIVIPDEYVFMDETNYITAEEESREYWRFFEKTEAGMKVKPFDGEGIICPEYASYINLQMFHKEEAATSFQIRMPFMKGMLHCVDFITFFSKECGLELEKSWLIKDYFGIERDLRNAKIILTKSMLKNADWIRDYVQKTNQTADGIPDPMKLYFERMKYYQHSFYIAATDLNLRNADKKVKLNYQFLNTLDMSREDFEKKINEYIEYIKTAETNPYAQREFVLGSVPTKDTAWKYALSRNITFITEESIRKQIKNEINSRIRDIYRGNILADGEIRFLSGDLLAFLIHLAKLVPEIDKSVHMELAKHCLMTTCFYSAVSGLKLIHGKTYGFLRNPHLSRNEQCVLNYTDDEPLYREYFGNLTGTVMVAYKSFAPMTMGGADFDGDLVKIITDIDIIKAMRAGKKECSAIAVIPDEEENSLPAPEKVEYRNVKDTFGNQIGEVSNLAIRLGEMVYSEKNQGKWSLNLPAHCTILTGLEIDSYKTGKHPKKNIAELKDLVKKEQSGEDYIYKLYKLQNLDSCRVLVNKTKEDIQRQGENCTLFYRTQEGNGKIKNIKLSRDSEDESNIEMLPTKYMETMFTERHYISSSRFKVDGKAPERFVQDFKRTEKEDELILSKVRAILKVYDIYSFRYRKICSGFQDLKNGNWGGKAFILLGKQYYNRKCYEEKLNGYYKLYLALESYMLIEERNAGEDENISSVTDKITERINQTEWIYTPEEERFSKLEEMLPGADAFLLLEKELGIVTNFSKSGFMLLYYMLKEIESKNLSFSRLITDPVYSVKNYDSSRMDKEMLTQAFEVLEETFQTAVRKKYTITGFQKMLRDDICEKLINNNLRLYCWYFYQIRPSFFWKLFDGDHLSALKEYQLITDNMPYKKWSEEADDLPVMKILEEETDLLEDEEEDEEAVLWEDDSEEDS